MHVGRVLVLETPPGALNALAHRRWRAASGWQSASPTTTAGCSFRLNTDRDSVGGVDVPADLMEQEIAELVEAVG